MTTVTIHPKAASEPGALDGFAIICSICGSMGSLAFRRMAQNAADEHRDWHERGAEAAKADMVDQIATQVHEMLQRITDRPSPDSDEGQWLEDLGQFGNTLHQLAHPEDPESQEYRPAIVQGVDRFLRDLSGDVHG